MFGLTVLSGLIAFSQTVIAQTSKKAAASGLAKKASEKRPPVFPTFQSEAQLRQAVYDSAATFVGKTEKTNQNDGAWIAAINRFNHLPKNAHYCASAFYYVHAINGVKLPVVGVGMVRSYFSQAKNIIYKRNGRGNQRIGKKPGRMDAVSIFASHVEGIAQDRYDPDEDDRVKCIGFNTTGGKGTKGGCYINYRRTAEIKMIANWITPYFTSLQSTSI
ncbi:hypothetical protein LX87_05180 [Larkinella arboricola]|uniref:Mannosyl-glycoprotein endo-beta-N-acetylglucosaminidase n=1 Tax=Larkinella arboricola TaxID=643671 RepID=A0A327WNU9_LARAB|nr:hypothetical protein LX87_05180 [Larkinella arboricola]